MELFSYPKEIYYTTNSGRFISKDAYKSDTMQPSTLNRYAYCQGNPVNFTDPSGLNSYTISELKKHIEDYEGYLRQINIYQSRVDSLRESVDEYWGRYEFSEDVYRVAQENYDSIGWLTPIKKINAKRKMDSAEEDMNFNFTMYEKLNFELKYGSNQLKLEEGTILLEQVNTEFEKLGLKGYEDAKIRLKEM